jgi:tRNA A37 threonylcarbamoyladenosine modification protein TsaB
MNLFLSTLGKTPWGFFFTDSLSSSKEVIFERNDFFIDRLSVFPELQKVENIFYVSGPASFTALRNMSVFLNVFTQFSQKKISLFAIPTAEFLAITFPHAQAHILSVGKRESFVFETQMEQDGTQKFSGKKYKNSEAIEYLQKKNREVLGGEMSENFLEKTQNSFTFAFPERQKEVFIKILEKSQKNPKHWRTNSATIEYGALPNIG